MVKTFRASSKWANELGAHEWFIKSKKGMRQHKLLRISSLATSSRSYSLKSAQYLRLDSRTVPSLPNNLFDRSYSRSSSISLSFMWKHREFTEQKAHLNFKMLIKNNFFVIYIMYHSVFNCIFSKLLYRNALITTPWGKSCTQLWSQIFIWL